MQLLLCLFSVIFFYPSFSQELTIIPQPASVKKEPGNFSISRKTVLVVKDDEDRKAANFFNDYLSQLYGFKLDIDKQEGKDYIRLTTRKFVP